MSSDKAKEYTKISSEEKEFFKTKERETTTYLGYHEREIAQYVANETGKKVIVESVIIVIIEPEPEKKE